MARTPTKAELEAEIARLKAEVHTTVETAAPGERPVNPVLARCAKRIADRKVAKAKASPFGTAKAVEKRAIRGERQEIWAEAQRAQRSADAYKRAGNVEAATAAQADADELLREYFRLREEQTSIRLFEGSGTGGLRARARQLGLTK